jgi:hypothetical protein
MQAKGLPMTEEFRDARRVIVSKPVSKPIGKSTLNTENKP